MFYVVVSADCEFGNLQVSLIKDEIIWGTNKKNEDTFQERHLREFDLILLRAVSAGHAAEECQHVKEILLNQPQTSTKLINSKQIIKKGAFYNSFNPTGICPAHKKLCLNSNIKNLFKIFISEIEKSYTK